MPKPKETSHPDERDENVLIQSCIQRVQDKLQWNERYQTSIPFLSFIQQTQPTLTSRGLLKPSFCLILQGRKQFCWGENIIHYGAGEYLVSTIDMPSTGQVSEASARHPYLSIRIELDIKELSALALEANIEVRAHKKAVSGAFVGTCDLDSLDAIHRLLKLLDKPKDAVFLANTVKRELLYRMLTGANGHLFYQNVLLDQQELGIGKVIYWLKEHFDQPVKVDQLAKLVNMSVSSLQHKFKDVTAMGPLQYQKQLRLQEARRLLLTGSVDASTAAYQVGYESQSQFSREYRRQFGAPPMQDARLNHDQPKDGRLRLAEAGTEP